MVDFNKLFYVMNNYLPIKNLLYYEHVMCDGILDCVPGSKVLFRFV